MSPLAFIRENARFLTAGGVLSLTSSYGQTYFIAIFAAQILLAYDLTDGEWGLVYTAGTTASAVVMLWAGALTDRFRVRALAMVVLPVLAFLCIAMAVNTSLVGLVVIIFALRLFGQGMTSQLAITAMARWFVARRGMALSISAMGFAIGQSAFPFLFANLLERFDWRLLWWIAAAMVIVTVPIILSLLTKERTPQSLAKESVSVGMDGHHWTRGQMIRSPLFWFLLPMLLGPPSWGTALFFQQVHIAEVKGWDLTDYLALLPLLTAVSVITTILSGQAIDRFGSSRLAMVYLVPFAVCFFLLSSADTLWAAAIALMIFGLGSGVQATLPAAFWSEYYGTANIGSIKAVSTSIMVLGSAIGPGISGLLIDAGFSFPEQAAAISLYFVVAMVFVWIGVRQAAPRLPRSAQIDVERA